MSEPKRYTAAGSGVVKTDPKGDLVLYVDYVRLLAEVKELKSQPDPLTAYLYAAELAKDDIKRLKAEVEAQAKRWAESEDLISHYKEQRDEVINDCQCARLKAEVERLTKAGDTMRESIICGTSSDDIQAVLEWDAAKEGNGQP